MMDSTSFHRALSTLERLSYIYNNIGIGGVVSLNIEEMQYELIQLMKPIITEISKHPGQVI